jgi:DNA-binding LytR/AlgR family response regulator
MKLNIKEINFLELIGEFEDAIKANDFIANNNVDLMFLDIQMPNLSGIDFLKSIKNPPLTILTTAYPQFALESYDLDIVDYLVKPIRIERFIKAVNKAQEIFEYKKSEKTGKERKDYVYIKSDRKYIKLNFSDIQYIEGLKDYVIVYTSDNKYITAMNIKTIYNQLPSEIFFRVSKSYIININNITEIDNDFVKVNKKEIPIGRTYKEEFLNYINKHLIKR